MEPIWSTGVVLLTWITKAGVSPHFRRTGLHGHAAGAFVGRLSAGHVRPVRSCARAGANPAGLKT